MAFARLTRYGVLAVAGLDAREFLHAQLTNDVLTLPKDRAALAGWCSAKGRLLASFLVIPTEDGFLLQLARDLAPAIAKRLSMFVLWSKVKVTDESEKWAQLGAWGDPASQQPFGVTRDGDAIRVRIDDHRTLLLTTAPEKFPATLDETRWTLDEIRAGRPLITAATQELFVPQMVNLHTLGGVDFRKGCYPGQEIVARTQYRGQLKRHMVHAVAAPGTAVAPGADYQGGTVVDAAPADTGTELLAVVSIPGS